MKRLASILVLLSSLGAFAADAPLDGERASVIVVVGAAGTPEYGDQFNDWGEKWRKASETAGARMTLLGKPEGEISVREQLHRALGAEPPTGSGEVWLVLLGHGTSDAQGMKFNVEGDDVSVADLVEWLGPIQRPVVVVAGFSTSGALLKPLARRDRVVVTATRSGSEENFSRFGGYISTAIGDPEADLDKDGEVSLLEAWLTAARRVADFYKEDGRLATEHSLLDDNGDGLGTPADWFEGTRAVKKPKNGAAVDGLRASQIHLIRSAAENALSASARAKRDALELEVAKLRDAKGETKEAEYYQKLERLLLEIARLYES